MTNSEMEVDHSDESCASKTNLIVNYLPPEITLGAFVKIFQPVGKIDSFRLVKDKDTGENLGYGFINYCRKEDAEVAVKTLNGIHVSNKTIRVAYARPDAPKSVNLFVSGLPPTMHLHELKNLFSEYGRVITTRLLLDDNKTVGGGVQKVNALGFVRFEEKADAERAIAELNGIMLEGSTEPLTVMFPTENAKRLNASFAEFIKGKTKKVATTLKLKSKTGAGGKEGIPINKGVNRYSPMGNVGYTPSTQVGNGFTPPAAIGNGFIHPTPMGNGFTAQPLGNFLFPVGTPMGNMPSTNQGHVVYIFGLDESSSDAILWELFGRFGSIQSAKVVKDPVTDKCKGFGFVTMYNYEDAQKAIQVLNGCQHGNRRLQVSFKTKKNA
uniref:Putative elav/hud family splicing factor n=1 Tax=Panstrongylus lignarius TaxID=156445 RepID=A0A224XQC2_9HEMI